MKQEVKKAAREEAKKAVKEHETKHHAAGGMVCRGGGCATKGKRHSRDD